MVKASSYRQSTVKSGINVESEKNEANNCTEYIFILWNVASNISHHPFISAYTGGKKKSTGKKNRKQLTYSKNQTKSHYKNERINSQSDHDFIPFVFYHDSAFILAHKL